MKIITITSENSLSNLSKFIKHTNPRIKTELESNILTLSFYEKSFSKITTSLAVYILIDLHQLLLKQISKFLKINYTEDSVIKNLCTQERYVSYIEPLKILLTDYFKDNSSLDIDSFILFNCRGLQQEIYKIGQDYISIYQEEKNNQKNLITKADENNQENKFNLIDSTIAYQAYFKELNKLFEEFSDKVKVLGEDTDFLNFEHLHLKSIDDEILLVDINNELVENLIRSFLSPTVLYSTIEKELEGVNKTLKIAILMHLCIIAFNTKSIVFHKSVGEDVTTQLLLYLSDSKDTSKFIEEVNLFKCNGCDFC